MRSVLVDGAPIARIGDVVTQIEPLDDGRQAWILAHWRTYCPMWRVYLWSLDDGALLDLEAGEGTGAGIAVRARRVFIGGQSHELRWQDLGSGESGSVAVEPGDEFAGCTPDGRYLATRRTGEMRTQWARVRPVDGGEPFPAVRAPLVFSDDGRFAVHLSEDRTALVCTSLADRAAREIPLPLAAAAPAAGAHGAPVPPWLGLRPVRGAPAVVVWDALRLMVVDLEAGRAGASIAAEGLGVVDDATPARISLARRARRPELLDLATGELRELSDGARPLVLAPDGRRALRHRRSLLDVIDTATGALARAHDGQEEVVRHLAWSADGARVASAASDGRVRILRIGAPGAPAVQLAAPSAHLVFAPGDRLCTVSPTELALWDATTGASLARVPSFGTHIHSAQLSADGRYLLAGSYSHGLRVFDFASGAPLLVESEATKECSYAAFAGDGVVGLRKERRAGPSYLRPEELLHWLVLDGRGTVTASGTWRFEGDVSIGVAVRGASAGVTAYAQGHLLHVYDLRAPAAPPRVLPIERGAELLDLCAGRALIRDRSELICLDTESGAELARLRCLRRPFAGALAPGGAAFAVAYADHGVEVFEI